MRISWTRRTLLCFFFYNYFCLKLEDGCAACVCAVAVSVCPYPRDTCECPCLLYRYIAISHIIIIIIVIRDQRRSVVSAVCEWVCARKHSYSSSPPVNQTTTTTTTTTTTEAARLRLRLRLRLYSRQIAYTARPDKHYRISLPGEDYNYNSSSSSSRSDTHTTDRPTDRSPAEARAEPEPRIRIRFRRFPNTETENRKPKTERTNDRARVKNVAKEKRSGKSGGKKIKRHANLGPSDFLFGGVQRGVAVRETQRI